MHYRVYRHDKSSIASRYTVYTINIFVSKLKLQVGHMSGTRRYPVGNIGATYYPNAEVGVATENGKSYYQITSLLRQSRVPYVDVILGSSSQNPFVARNSTNDYNSLKIIITTRKERLQLDADQVICIEDLGQDSGLLREKLIPILSPKKDNNCFTVGIDPGKRIGLAAYFNQLEIESIVVGSVEDAVARVGELLQNAPDVRKTIKIGAGIPKLAQEIAATLEKRFGSKDLRIKLVDERGTSSLYARRKNVPGTRDQQAARLIAFRDGRDFSA
jgi:RNase H-fold protein (predicted Holliday junction resolvase)